MIDNIHDIKGIGEKTEKYFNNLGIYTPYDLLYYFPKDYEEYQEIINISNVKIGKVATVKAIVVSKPTTFRSGHLNITSVYLDDGTSKIKAYWFNIPFINKSLTIGKAAIFRGKVSQTKNGYAFSQCKIYKIEDYEKIKGMLNPIYPLTKGLTNANIIKAIKNLLVENNLQYSFVEYLPHELMAKRKLCDIKFALNHIHFPKNFDDLLRARTRLVYDEFFVFSLAMLVNKDKTIKLGRKDLEDIDVEYLNNLILNLPFKLTNGQKEIIDELIKEVKSGKKMNRLIEGDVGSGKTIIAILLALMFVKKKVQVAFMAPTEVLAEQHYKNILKLNEKVQVALLTGSTKIKERKEILAKLKSGDIDILVGTHALFSKDVEYKDLGLCIIDEQHRFGVSQRKALEDKSNNAHVIVMSATPIPRTLAMLLYADLDICLLKDKPANRKSIKNCVINEEDREKGYKAIKKEIDRGHQAYVICPAIEKNDKEIIGSFADYQNVIEYAEKLKKYLGKNVNIEILHGKMKQNDKNKVMENFKEGNTHILVSTTVVEVGVDVPNATFIMIEDAGAFGLSELHQLRGRVGRGDAQSYALFVDTTKTNKSKERLDVLYNSNDGFFIAEEDLRLRGPGDIFGVKQSGEMDFKIADMYTDIGIFKMASADAKKCIDENIKLSNELNVKLNEYIKNGSVL